MRIELTDKIAVVTGASKGIGLAISQAFAEAGAFVVAGARTNSPGLEALEANGSAMFVAADLSTADGPKALVAAAAEKAGADVVVDTSKTTPGALFLDLCGAEYSLLHVMRRPEAVVSSTLRSRGVERGNAESAPPGGSLAVGVARWVWANLNAVLVLKISRARSAVRWDYERFVENAEQMTLELVASLGIPPDSSPFVGRTVELGESHSAVGNPGRGGERITLREDDRWRSELSATDQRLIQTMTWPVVSWLGGQAR